MILQGHVTVPGDKSIGHRAQMLAALADGESRISGLSVGADVVSTRTVLSRLGVNFAHQPDGGWHVQGRGLRGLRASTLPLDCGNSGTTLRLMLGILAGQTGRFELVGDASLSVRPMRRVTDRVAELGGRFELPEGDHPPVVVQGGPLRGTSIDTRGASAQVKSAALLAGLLAEGTTEVTERGPSRDHTERMLQAAGVALERQGLRTRLRAPERIAARHWQVPGDVSSAAFWCAAAAILPASVLTIHDVGLNPTRTGFLDVLRAMQVRVEAKETAIWCGEPVGDIVVHGGTLRGARIDGDVALRALDELPLVAVLGALAEGETVVADARELRVKESDRIAAMTDGLRAMGARIDATTDGWHIEGVERLRGATIATRHDHRIAMAHAVADLRAEGSVVLDDPHVAAVSYPGFIDALQAQVIP
jgi:3-phosphoshikimate 1-carboxyvinyltransferase